MDDDDDFDFSDRDLDDLPANTLQQLETTAIRATQHREAPAPESDYGLDDGDEVINLDDAARPPQPSPWVNAPPQHHQHYQQDDHQTTNVHDNGYYSDAMEVEEQPRRSQADPNQLLLRIKKVQHPSLYHTQALLTLAARAGQGPSEPRPQWRKVKGPVQVWRGGQRSSPL